MKEFAKLYDVIKNERNKCVNLIQTSTQKAAEMKEKIKMLQNEIEILRHTVNDKDKLVSSLFIKTCSDQNYTRTFLEFGTVLIGICLDKTGF